MTIGIAILRRDTKTGAYSLAYTKDFAAERQVELDVLLEEGEYVILPRTSGCNMRKPPGTQAVDVPSKLLDATGQLHSIVALQVKDIFRRLDKVMINNSLEFNEFQEFFARLGIRFTADDFKKNILRKFCSASGSVNRRGFLEFFRDAVVTQGESAIRRWLERWGYDRELYPQESRCFMLTLHSLQPIAVQIEEVAATELDALVCRLLVSRNGKEVEKRAKQYRLLQHFCEGSYTFTFAIQNLGARTCEVTLDCNQSRNMLFSETAGRITRLIQPGATEFFMHAEAAPGAEEIARAAKITYREVY